MSENKQNGPAQPKHRAHLPMPNTLRPNVITYDAQDPETHFPPIDQLRPPQGAPHVLIVLIEDAGFGSSSAFGAPSGKTRTGIGRCYGAAVGNEHISWKLHPQV